MFHFTANLKPYTFTDRPEGSRFDAYLLSADYARPGNLEMAAQVREEGRLLVADNGNVDLLREFAVRFKDEAKTIDDARKEWEKDAGHYARPGDLPNPLTKKFAALAKKIADASQLRVTEAHTQDAITRQTSMNPDFLIGMEDLTLGTMAALNLEPEYISEEGENGEIIIQDDDGDEIILFED